jgi:hypothetical protein
MYITHVMGKCVKCHKEMEDFPGMTLLRDKTDVPGMCMINDICDFCANLNIKHKITTLKEEDG